MCVPCWQGIPDELELVLEPELDEASVELTDDEAGYEVEPPVVVPPEPAAPPAAP